MGTRSFSNEERLGLVLAIAIHCAILAVLVMRPPAPPPPIAQRMSVTLADNVGLRDASPQPAEEAKADAGPVLGEAAPPPPEIAPKPEPKPVPKPAPVVVKPVPKPAPKPKPAPVLKPLPKVIKVDQVKPVPVKPTTVKTTPANPKTKPVIDPISQILAGQKGQVKSSTTGAKPDAKPVKQAGASKIDSKFLDGIAGGKPNGKSATPAAVVASPAVESALRSAISRQLKPRWVAPQGADADQLVTILAWDLNLDGSLVGSPRVLRQEGVTESNQHQADRHAEQAIRAVKLAAPFPLPEEYYTSWKRIKSFRFDRKLSQ